MEPKPSTDAIKPQIADPKQHYNWFCPPKPKIPRKRSGDEEMHYNWFLPPGPKIDIPSRKRSESFGEDSSGAGSPPPIGSPPTFGAFERRQSTEKALYKEFHPNF
uniref:Uncharacterized protein n=1 Tax=Pinctada fucata TaxID=50426 RepID=A0A194AMD1_PINFU